MDKEIMQRLSYNLSRKLRNFSWQEWGLVALALSVGASYFLLVLPAQQGLAEVNAQAALVKQKLDRIKAGVEVDEPKGEVERFDAFFPAEHLAADSFEQIFALADKNGLALKQADYRVTKSNVGELINYQLTLPLRGEYPHVIRFIASVLGQINNLSLDHFVFERQKIGDGQIDATLLLTLYIKREQ